MPKLDAKQAAEYLGVTVATVRRFLWQRRLVHYKIGRRVVIEQRDLDRFLEAHRPPARDESPVERRWHPGVGAPRPLSEHHGPL
jgi:excisionase family DNA binding protein